MTLADATAPPPARPPSSARERFERIYGTLRDRICLLEYAPGSMLSEDGLAAEFQTSRTPVRRVLSRLEAEGLVESRHGVGTFVTDATIEALLPVFQLRMALAELIGRLSPLPRSVEDLDRVRALLARADELARAPDPKGFVRLNMDFFYELSAMTGNPALREINERLYFQTTRIWLKSVPQLNLAAEIAVFQREMADILGAMEIGDLEAVGHIRRSHISMSVARMTRYASGSLPAA